MRKGRPCGRPFSFDDDGNDRHRHIRTDAPAFAGAPLQKLNFTVPPQVRGSPTVPAIRPVLPGATCSSST